MTREQQYWKDAQEALSRVLDRCEEIDLQSGYDMLEDIQFIRGFINKHKPRTENQELILDKIRDEIRHEQNMDCKCHRKTYDNCLRIIDKYKVDIRGEEV